MLSQPRSVLFGALFTLLCALCVSCSEPEIFPASLTPDFEPFTTVTLEPDIQPFYDPTAADGKAVALYRTGETARFTVPSGLFSVDVRARGDLYEGAPEIRLMVNGEQYLFNVVVEDTVYADQRIGRVSIPAGATVEVDFANDKWGGTRAADRNVYIDSMSLFVWESP